MSFETEKVTEFWLGPMWASMPMPDGDRRLVENTRQFWACYWYLRDHLHYADPDLADFAKRISTAKRLPYELSFALGVYSISHDRPL